MGYADSSLWIGGIIAEALVVGILIWRRTYRTLPVFSAYLAFSLISDLGQQLIAKHTSQSANFRIYLIGLAIDSLFQFGVLIEL